MDEIARKVHLLFIYGKFIEKFYLPTPLLPSCRYPMRLQISYYVTLPHRNINIDIDTGVCISDSMHLPSRVDMLREYQSIQAVTLALSVKIYIYIRYTIFFEYPFLLIDTEDVYPSPTLLTFNINI